MNNYTRLPNDFVEILLSEALSADEMKILLYIARKTYGFNKISDGISLTQFQEKLSMGRKYVNIALSRLRLVSLVILVKKGTSIKAPNIYKIDYSDYASKLVSLSKLVSKRPQATSIRPEAKILHTKESITKEKHESFAEVDISSNEKAWNEYSPAYLKSLGISDPQFIETARQAFISKAKAATQNAVKIFINNQKKYTPPDPADYKTDLWEGQNG